MAIYSYKVSGINKEGKEWTVQGTVGDEELDFVGGVQLSLGNAFVALTQGKAVYGQPGTTCQGPYKVLKYEIELQ